MKDPAPGPGSDPPFWKTRTLDEMSDAEWESLCDGCGRCCLQKLEDEDSGEVHFTRVACRLLDLESCRCRDYTHRRHHVEDCLSVRPLTDEKRGWLPSSCAYRRLDEGRDLADWHPLVSGDPASVHRAGISMSGRAVTEMAIPLHEFVRHLIEWKDEQLVEVPFTGADGDEAANGDGEAGTRDDTGH